MSTKKETKNDLPPHPSELVWGLGEENSEFEGVQGCWSEHRLQRLVQSIMQCDWCGMVWFDVTGYWRGLCDDGGVMIVDT